MMHQGGGLFVRSGSATLTQSTVSGNSTGGNNDAQGGGLFVHSGSATLTQSSVVNNSSVVGAGGLSNNMYNASINVTLTNSILAGNTGPEGNFEDRATTPVGLLNVNFSLFGDPAAEITDPTSIANYYSNAPDLGPLQHNGGPTQTHKPNPLSPAFDQGSNTEAVSYSLDQRGSSFPRIHNGTVDIGAVELQNNPTTGGPPLNPNEILTRRDMARELLKAKLGTAFTPLLATGTEYADVKIGDINADWIEKFKIDLYTEDCAADKFCADSVVSREEIAIPFLKVIGASGPSSGNNFVDVPQGSFSAGAITILRDLGYTAGCGTNKFCPKEPVTREWFEFLLSQI